MISTNFRFGEVKNLLEQVSPQNAKVSFQQIFENENGGVSVLAFNAGQELAEHLAPAEVMVYVAEGEIEFTMNGEQHQLKRGDFLLMGCDVPHSVKAVVNAKVVLVKVRP